MDGPKDYYPKWSKTKKDKYHTYMRNLKNDTNELIHKTETDSDKENKFLVTKGAGRGWIN